VSDSGKLEIGDGIYVCLCKIVVNYEIAEVSVCRRERAELGIGEVKYVSERWRGWD